MTNDIRISRKALPRILVLSAYDAASHKRWRHQLAAMFAEYTWQSLSLPARFFAWRIRGNPLSWLNEPCLSEPWDLVIATSMVDLASIRSFHPGLARTPWLLYMHENQFAFPSSSHQMPRLEPQMVNLYSAISATRVVFNSAWNLDSFLNGVQTFLDRMPDGVPTGLVTRLRDKSCVIPVPIEDDLFLDIPRQANWNCPHLLWNHRWEYDKGPERLLRFLQRLDALSVPFSLSVVGERFRSQPKVFDEIYREFSSRVVYWGFLASREEYDRLLGSADIVISTAIHDFQGLSMLEAMASGCLPLAPDRLAYREYVPDVSRYESFEHDIDKEAEAAAACLINLMTIQPVHRVPEAWRMSVLARQYQSLFEQLLSERPVVD
ncbi:tRNA-queuosine alpha-mannosyltransferase domain-containing protein [Allohahella marinimesophila]|uniref:tRNA-queuosine alpha-mannosyltransferase n=1 Tax=Allohahella marinimesophila TaxID=1054972 RepID=A0ABP7PC09_9GAMM